MPRRRPSFVAETDVPALEPLEQRIVLSVTFLESYGGHDYYLTDSSVTLAEARGEAQGLADSLGLTMNEDVYLASINSQGEEMVSPARRDRALEFLSKYFEALSLSVYWGSAKDFIGDLESARAEYEEEQGHEL